MISAEFLYNTLQAQDITFYAGVPDSLLKNLCAYITDHAEPGQHVIAANEGGAVALAAGYHLATGKVGVVYMQNSGGPGSWGTWAQVRLLLRPFPSGSLG